MLATSKIIIAVKKKLEKNFKGIKIQSQDIEEGFLRPSFFIELDNIKVEDFMKKLQEKNITVRITYFPSTLIGNQAENLKTLDKLNETFLEDNILELDDNYVTEVNEVDTSISNRLVHYSFEIFLSEEYIRNINKEMIEELDIKIKKEGN